MRKKQRSSLPRVQTALAVRLLTLCVVAAASQQLRFQPAATGAGLQRRQTTGCLANMYSCATQGAAFNNVCCMYGQICALDANNNPACCPAGDVCTGTAPGTFVAPTTTTPISYVSNPYFSYPYMATSFPNSAACLSAVSQCGADYSACTADLEGLDSADGYGVTIVVPGGGGVTVSPSRGSGLGTSSATSICASLSSEACSGFQSTQCYQTGTPTAGFYVGTSNAAPRPTANCRMAGAVVVAGVGMGIFGGL